MKLFFVSLNLLVFTFTNSAFAFGVVAPNAPSSPKSKVLGIVRVENEIPVCVQYPDLNKVNLNNLQLPLCSSDASIAEETQQLLLAAKNEGQQTAFLSHIGAAVLGCGISFFATFGSLGITVASYSTIDPTTAAMSGPALTGAALLFPALSDPTMHGLSGAVGFAACSGVTYYIYKSTYR